jgi:hypothetical protein
VYSDTLLYVKTVMPMMMVFAEIASRRSTYGYAFPVDYVVAANPDGSLV